MKKLKRISIRLFIRVFSIVSFILMLLIILYLANAADNSLRNQATRIYENTLDLYRDRVDRSLSALDNYLYNFMYKNDNVSLLEFSVDEQERYFVKKNLSEELNQLLLMHDFSDGVFFYSPLGSEVEYITRTTGMLSLSESKVLQSHMYTIINSLDNENKLESSKWFVDKINGKNYLIRIIYYNQSYCGAWVDIESFSASLNEMDFGENGFSLVCSTKGEILTDFPDLIGLQFDHEAWQVVQIQETSYLQISADSTQCEYVIVALLPLQDITGEWVHAFHFVKWFALMFLIILLIFLLCSNFMYKPLNVLVSAMKMVKTGSLDEQISTKTRLVEFEQVYDIFNSMVEEIRDLKISVYEQKIEEQKVKRQYLQIQLKSHFYLNCLNIIYSLAQIKDYALIQKMTMYLVHYFRYMLNDSSKWVPLKSELDHVANYMNIQALRFPDMLTYHTDIEENCLEYTIPPLMLQTFIENTIEHAIDFDRHNIISLSINEEDRQTLKGLRIIITDNGLGFSQAVLEKIKKNAPTTIETGKGIGINNIRSRLKLLYHDQAKLTFYNCEPHGAVVDIWLPKHTE